MHPKRILLGAALCAAALDASASCGSAFCLVNTDWSAQGAWTESGARFDLRYEFIDLDQPMAGRDKVSVDEIPAHHDEVYTKNRNLVGTVDWALSPAWAISASLPYVDRQHLHIHNHHGEQLEERWDFREIGDARVQARYVLSELNTPELLCQYGFTFGVKLPTGKHDVANGEGDLAERSLQPGTGTTDALLGWYWSTAKPLTGWSHFVRGQVVLPMNTKDEYKPGAQAYVDVGARYAVNPKVAVMVQANAVWKDQDKGANAEPEDSGQHGIFVSPGVSWNVSRDVQAYAFVQVPVYQWVRGVQLTADWSAMAGVSLRF